MKRMTLLPFLFALALAACEDGPAERLGEDIDRAVDDIGDAAEEACEEVSNRPC